jgi:hypothetical protein
VLPPRSLRQGPAPLTPSRPRGLGCGSTAVRALLLPRLGHGPPPVKARSRACNHALLRVLWYWTQLLRSAGLWCCHTTRGSRPRLPAWEVSGAAMRPADPDLASLRGRAPVPPRVLRLRTLPPWLGGLWSRHASCGSGLRLPAWEGSGATTCPTTRGGRIKKYLATMVKLQGSRVTEDHSRVPRHLQDARAGDIIMTCKVCRHVATVPCYTRHAGRRLRHHYTASAFNALDMIQDLLYPRATCRAWDTV